MVLINQKYKKGKVWPCLWNAEYGSLVAIHSLKETKLNTTNSEEGTPTEVLNSETKTARMAIQTVRGNLRVKKFDFIYESKYLFAHYND